MLRRFALALGIALLTSSAVPTPRAVTVTPSIPPVEDEGERLDMYGNEVVPAVATYSLDADGAPYEVHSPQTEIPRLGSPKS